MEKNKSILRSMIRLSRIIKDLKEARYKLNSAISQVDYYIVNGETSDFIKDLINKNIDDILYLEQYLHSSVSNACKYLDGYSSKYMEPINYISSSDVKNKFVDICLGGKVKATVNITTGEIQLTNQSIGEKLEEKEPSEKS